MRLSVRNKQKVYYATYVSKTAIVDEYGNETGESQITYSTPVLANWNVHGTETDAEVEMFGIKAINTIRVVAEKPLSIDETSVLWYGKLPHSPYVATAPDYNYRVIGILPTLNDAVFYAQKVDVS